MDATEDEPTSFIYLSPDALSNPSKLLVLIQGSGVVRAGQWARRLIINQDLDSGTQIPFITRAMAVGDTIKEVEAILLEAELIYDLWSKRVSFHVSLRGTSCLSAQEDTAWKMLEEELLCSLFFFFL